MKLLYILNARGDPIEEPDTIRWAEWLEKNFELRRVGYTKVSSKVEVSTIFLGMDQNMPFGKGRPVLWETMIFGGRHHLYQQRYSSREDAVIGHEKAVRIAREEVPNGVEASH